MLGPAIVLIAPAVSAIHFALALLTTEGSSGARRDAADAGWLRQGWDSLDRSTLSVTVERLRCNTRVNTQSRHRVGTKPYEVVG
jgi:hypothetical protein